LPRVKVLLCHVAMTERCGSDNTTCQYYARHEATVCTLVFIKFDIFIQVYIFIIYF